MNIIVAGIGSKLSKDNLQMVAGKDGTVLTYGDFEKLNRRLNNLTGEVCRK